MSQHLPSPVRFREDINGLRAWAVMGVLLFHFSIVGLSGGFAGVDIFFVISGYLMTAIIVGGHEKGNFSLRRFYMARVRRILPALMVLIAVLLGVGWFILSSPEYRELGGQSLYGLSFLSNIYFWRTADYFDSGAHEKWLLHTWSLGVEAQFYVLFPLLVAGIWRFWQSLKAVTIGLLVLFLLSLGANIVMTQWQVNSAFYLLPMRGWELASGGLVYLIARQNWASEGVKSWGFWLGWALVIGSFIWLNEQLAWPGFWAVLPVLGVSLIILAQKEFCLFTHNRFSQWLGERSYSLYLWHWPLVVVLYFANLQHEWLWVGLAIIASLILGHLSYHFIEVPTRRYLSQKTMAKEVVVIGLMGMVLAGGAFFIKTHEFPQRLPEKVEKMIQDPTLKMPMRENGYCFYSFSGHHDLPVGEVGQQCFIGDQKGQNQAILFGDSFAGQYEPFWDKVGKQLGLKIQSVTTNWCYPSDNEAFTGEKSHPSYQQCLLNRAWLKQQVGNTPLIIFSGQYADIWQQQQSKGLLAVMKTFADHGSQVVMMPSPKLYDRNFLLQFIRSQQFGTPLPEDILSHKDKAAQQANHFLEKWAANYPNIHFLNRSMLFANQQGQITDLTPQGLPYTLDGQHISIHGAQSAAQNFLQHQGDKLLESIIRSENKKLASASIEHQSGKE